MRTVPQMIKRITRTWSDLDYAQRRLMEIRTGLELTTPRERRELATTPEELERLYALEETQRAA